MFLNIIKTIIIGIIEGITEWLPISSTGHMILANEFIKLDVSSEFWKMFEVVIQLGAIMAVVVIYFKDLFPWGFNKTKEDIETGKTYKVTANYNTNGFINEIIITEELTNVVPQV